MIERRLWLLALILSPACLQAQATATASADMPTLQLSSKLVLIDAIVAEKKTGRLQGSLGREDFRIEEDGVSQEIRFFGKDALPLSTVLLFDLTGSVQPELKELGAAAAEVLSGLKARDEVAVMTFSSSTQLLQPFTLDRSLAGEAIRTAAQGKTRDGTFLDEDVYEAAEFAAKSASPGSRPVLVFFTDGTSDVVNAMSRKFYGKGAPSRIHTRSEASEELLRTGVVVSALIDRSIAGDAAIATALANPLSYLVGVNPRLGDVQRYAAETGGPVIKGGKKPAAAKLAALLTELRERYTIGYVPSAEHSPGTFCRVGLHLTPGALAAHPELATKDYAVEARAGYYR